MIPVFRPYYDEREEQAVLAVLRSRWIGLGPKTKEFEDVFAGKVGALHAVALDSCTASLHLALKLAGIEAGDEVLVPTITFVSTAHAVTYLGAKPIFCDVEPQTLMLDWRDAMKKRTSKTKAILPVLYAGQPYHHPDTDLKMIYDCAHAAGSNFDVSDKVCCWSFHAVKNLAVGDGGMLTLSDPDQAQRAKRLRWLGIDKATWDRNTNRAGYQWEYQVREIGYKYHMNDIVASLGITQTQKLDEMQEKRKLLVERYFNNLKGKVSLPPYDNRSSWHLFHIRVPYGRDELITYLMENGVSAGVHYKPIHLYPCYGEQKTLPVAEEVWKTLVTLPLYPELELEEVDYICQLVEDFMDRES